MAKRASLARDYGNTIKTPRELYDWAVQKTDKCITKLNFCYICKEQYTKNVRGTRRTIQSSKTYTWNTEIS